ncbi:unnamed protein product [Adineta ricciae]|nr:unnamed protein product [Adineta ricciae]
MMQYKRKSKKDADEESAQIQKESKQGHIIDRWGQKYSEYPPPKTCTYINISSGSSFLQQPFTVNYFPLAFGFIETYLLGTISRTVYYEDKHQVVNETCIPKKSRDFSRLIPGDLTTYEFQFGHEAEYKRQYMSAYFAITKKKAGWDCNRHYEIIASAATPYFENLNESGSYTLSHPQLSVSTLKSLIY